MVSYVYFTIFGAHTCTSCLMEFCLYNIRKKTMIFLNDKSFLSSFQHMHTCMITMQWSFVTYVKSLKRILPKIFSLLYFLLFLPAVFVFCTVDMNRLSLRCLFVSLAFGFDAIDNNVLIVAAQSKVLTAAVVWGQWFTNDSML